MPGVVESIAALIVYAAAAAGVTVTAATASAIAVSLLTTVAITGIRFAIQAIVGQPGASAGPSSTTIDRLRGVQRSNVAPARVVYGVTRASGVLAYAESVTANGEIAQNGPYLHVVLIMAEGPIAGIENIIFNDTPLEDGSDEAERFKNLVLFSRYTGTSTQLAVQQTFSLAGTTVYVPKAWTASHRLQGIAYLYGILKFDRDVFPSGAPNIKADIRGRRLYDPRKDVALGGSHRLDDETTWEWSDNWGLCCLDYLMNRKYGMRASLDEIDMNSFIHSANVADEVVTAASGGTEKRYTVNGIFETDSQPIDVMNALLTAGGGVLTPRAPYRLIPAEPRPAAILTLTTADLRGPIQLLPKQGRKDRVNVVKGTFINPDKGYLPDSFTPVTSDVYLREDGGKEYSKELDFPFTIGEDRARRLAEISLKRMRQSIATTLQCNMTPFECQAWDVIDLTIDELGWDAKEFLVTNISLAQDFGGLDLDVVEYDANMFVADNLKYAGIDLSPPTELPAPFGNGPPGVTASEAIRTNDDGTRVSVISIDLTAPDDVLVQDYRIRWRNTDDATYQSLSTTELHIDIISAGAGSYELLISTRNQVGAYSDEVSVGVQVTYRTLPPPDVKTFLVSLVDSQWPLFQWTYSGTLPPDVRSGGGFEIRLLDNSSGAYGADPNAEWELARKIANPPGFTTGTQVPSVKTPGSYVAYIKMVDTTGLYSDNARFVEFEIPQPRGTSIVYEEDAAATGWRGTIVNAEIGPRGQLEAKGTLLWSDLTAWSAWTAWNQSPGYMSYIHPVIDLGEVKRFTVSVEIDNNEAPLYAIMRYGYSEKSLCTWRGLGYAVARYVQVGVAIDSLDGSAVVTKMVIRLLNDAVDEYVNDYRTDQSPNADAQIIQRREDDQYTLMQGDLLRNVRVVNGALQLGSIVREFNGTSQFISAPDGLHIRLSNSFTIECWIQRGASGQTGKRIIAKGTDYQLRWVADNAVDFYATGFTGDDPTAVANSMAVDPTMLVHVCYTYDGSILSGYVDGVLQIANNRVFTLATSNTSLTIGADATPANYFGGVIGRVRLWGRALSANEVAGAADGEFNGDEDGLVAYYRLDDAIDAAKDWSKYAIAGTPHYTPTAIRLGSRESPPMDLGMIARGYLAFFTWDEVLPSGCTIAVYASADGGSSWVTCTNRSGSPGLEAVPGLAAGADYAGVSLRLRQVLKSTVVANTPVLSNLISWLPALYAGGGTVLYLPTTDFAHVDLASVVAIQGVGAPVSAELVAKAPWGVRFNLYNVAGDPQDAIIDMLIRGQARAQQLVLESRSGAAATMTGESGTWESGATWDSETGTWD